MKQFFVYVETTEKPRLEWFDDWAKVLTFKDAQEKLGNVVYVYELLADC
jgi:hypothetical protein